MKRYINTLLKFAYQIIAIIRKERYYLCFSVQLFSTRYPVLKLENSFKCLSNNS